MYKVLKILSESRALIIGSAFSFFVIWRFNTNFREYDRAASKEKVYDLRRATEQLNLYRELYDPDKDIYSESIDTGDDNDRHDCPNKLLSVASEEDKAKIRKVFNQYSHIEDPDEIKKQIAKVKQQLELLEERKTTHQGIKLNRVMQGYEPSEEALKKIREHYRENKKGKNEKNI